MYKQDFVKVSKRSLNLQKSMTFINSLRINMQCILIIFTPVCQFLQYPPLVHPHPSTQGLVYVAQLLLTMGSALGCCQPTRGHITEENLFPEAIKCQKLLVTGCCSCFPPSRLGFCLCRLWAQCYSCCEFLGKTALLYLENAVSLMLSTTAAACNFFDHSSMKVSEPWVRSVIYISFRVEHSTYLIFCILTSSC